MMKFFTSIVSSCKDIAGKLRGVDAKANGRDVEGRQLMQQYGFISIPPSGSRILFLEFGNVIVGVASDGKDRPAVEEGETAVYRDDKQYIIFKKNGTIEIKAPKGVDIDGDLRVNGEVSDKVGKLSKLRDNYNQHTHIGNLGAPTAPTDKQDTGA